MSPLYFFFNAAPPAEIYTLSLHDALPISWRATDGSALTSATQVPPPRDLDRKARTGRARPPRSEEHTSELQSRPHLVCRLLLEKKKKKKTTTSRDDVMTTT